MDPCQHPCPKHSLLMPPVFPEPPPSIPTWRTSSPWAYITLLRGHQSVLQHCHGSWGPLWKQQPQLPSLRSPTDLGTRLGSDIIASSPPPCLPLLTLLQELCPQEVSSLLSAKIPKAPQMVIHANKELGGSKVIISPRPVFPAILRPLIWPMSPQAQ